MKKSLETSSSPLTAPPHSAKERVKSRDIIERLMDFENEGITASDRYHLRCDAAMILAQFRDALIEIRGHWACQYDHPKKSGDMYAGPYGIGVTDGHRCAAEIARAAITKATAKD